MDQPSDLGVELDMKPVAGNLFLKKGIIPSVLLVAAIFGATKYLGKK